MMLHIQYFARYREALGIAGEQLQWSQRWACLDDVRRYLTTRGGVWAVLEEAQLMCARNHELCSLEEAVTDGDEVAFFPTVSGG